MNLKVTKTKYKAVKTYLETYLAAYKTYGKAILTPAEAFSLSNATIKKIELSKNYSQYLSGKPAKIVHKSVDKSPKASRQELKVTLDMPDDFAVIRAGASLAIGWIVIALLLEIGKLLFVAVMSP